MYWWILKMLLNIFPPVSVLSMVPHLLAGNRLLKYLIALLLPGKSGRLLFCMLKKRDASFHTTKTPSVSQSISWEHVWAPQLIHSNCYYWHFAFLHLLSNCNQLLCNHLFQSEMDVDIIIIIIYYYLHPDATLESKIEIYVQINAFTLQISVPLIFRTLVVYILHCYFFFHNYTQRL